MGLLLLSCACSTSTAESSQAPDAAAGATQTGAAADPGTFAYVTAVSAEGAANGYTFSVTLSSPDTGCDQYANWWEVVDSHGALVYRRILAHSHADEQPFTRSGGPVSVDEEQVVFVRGHMHPAGYGGDVFKGSVAGGFQRVDSVPTFGAELESEVPQPTGCAF